MDLYLEGMEAARCENNEGFHYLQQVWHGRFFCRGQRLKETRPFDASTVAKALQLSLSGPNLDELDKKDLLQKRKRSLLKGPRQRNHKNGRWRRQRDCGEIGCNLSTCGCCCATRGTTFQNRG